MSDLKKYQIFGKIELTISHIVEANSLDKADKLVTEKTRNINDMDMIRLVAPDMTLHEIYGTYGDIEYRHALFPHRSGQCSIGQRSTYTAPGEEKQEYIAPPQAKRREDQQFRQMDGDAVLVLSRIVEANSPEQAEEIRMNDSRKLEDLILPTSPDMILWSWNGIEYYSIPYPYDPNEESEW